MTTVVADAVSYLLSALGIRAIGGREPQPPPARTAAARAGDLLEGWRYILAHPQLRPLFLNNVAVNGLIMASEPLLGRAPAAATSGSRPGSTASPSACPASAG